jgi:hypothetical protein
MALQEVFDTLEFSSVRFSAQFMYHILSSFRENLTCLFEFTFVVKQEVGNQFIMNLYLVVYIVYSIYTIYTIYYI